nr:hypothetical protein [Tanacetum cinerariifolium]
RWLWRRDDGSHGGHMMIMLLVDWWWRCGGARLEMEGVVVAAVVVLLKVGAARGGEWHSGSKRSGDKEHFWVRRKSFPATAVVAGGGQLEAGNNRERGPSVFLCYKK